jgi:hypothetical protein
MAEPNPFLIYYLPWEQALNNIRTTQYPHHRLLSFSHVDSLQHDKTAGEESQLMSTDLKWKLTPAKWRNKRPPESWMQIYDYSAKAQFVTRAQQTRNLRPGSKTLFTPAKERLKIWNQRKRHLRPGSNKFICIQRRCDLNPRKLGEDENLV